MTYRSITQSLHTSPVELVIDYYDAYVKRDLSTLKKVMTARSYAMTLQALGLKLSFRDADFKSLLAKAEGDENALLHVEKRLMEEEAVVKKLPSIVIQTVADNGTKRKIVHYTENGKAKKLYFSQEDEAWKINYLAGRRAD